MDLTKRRAWMIVYLITVVAALLVAYMLSKLVNR